MSDGGSHANRQAELVNRLEQRAEDLADVLLESGDHMFKVHPMALEMVNEVLKEKTGYKLVRDR